MKIAKQSFWTLANQISQAVSLFAISILISRSLGATGQGVYALLSVSINILLLVSTLGFDMAYMHIASRQQVDKRYLIKHAISASLVLGFIAAACVWLILILGGYNNLEGFNYSTWAIWCLPLFLLSSFMGGIFLGWGEIWIYNLINLLRPIILLLSLVLLVIIHKLTVNNIMPTTSIAP